MDIFDRLFGKKQKANTRPIYLIVIKDSPAPIDGPEYLKKVLNGKQIEPLAENVNLMIQPVQQIWDNHPYDAPAIAAEFGR